VRNFFLEKNQLIYMIQKNKSTHLLLFMWFYVINILNRFV